MTDVQTDICDSRVTFATENIYVVSYHGIHDHIDDRVPDDCTLGQLKRKYGDDERNIL